MNSLRCMVEFAPNLTDSSLLREGMPGILLPTTSHTHVNTGDMDIKARISVLGLESAE